MRAHVCARVGEIKLRTKNEGWCVTNFEDALKIFVPRSWFLYPLSFNFHTCKVG